MATKYLTNKHDYWVGTGKDEVIYARAGDDDLFGLSGKDELHGDDGNDSIRGGNQADKLYGDAGNDTLFGDNGDDTLWGGKGNDILTGNDGRDILYGGDGNDVVNGDGLDTTFGGNGNDVMAGGPRIDAGAGDDRLVIDLLGGEHVVARGGPGADLFKVYMLRNGAKGEQAEITDLDRGDRGADIYIGNGTGVFIHDGQIQQYGNDSLTVQGHDLVMTTLVDGNQLILRGAADWLHIS